MLDLFCGIGTIALVLALDAGEVWGVELVEEAVADAIENARLNGVDNAQFFAGDVRLGDAPAARAVGQARTSWWWTRPAPASRRRSCGASLEAEAQRIVYVSCNPTTLAPNARQIVDAAATSSRRVRPVDMFPQTPHIECVALLERPPSRRPRSSSRATSSAGVHACTGTAPPVSSEALISSSVSLRAALRAAPLDHRVDAFLSSSSISLRLAPHDVLSPAVRSRPRALRGRSTLQPLRDPAAAASTRSARRIPLKLHSS